MARPAEVIVAVDVETTGLHSADRIVTLGALRLNVSEIRNGGVKLDWLYFIADPGKKSHPRAEAVHGYDDWLLRHQEPFSENARVAGDFISSGNILIAHNASFDCRFIDNEYGLLGTSAPKYLSYCTMNRYRQAGLPGRASLSAICGQIGLARTEKRHGALEDAWLAMMVYFYLNDLTQYITPFEEVSRQGLPKAPTNLIQPPPMPPGPLPRRKKKSNEPIVESVVEIAEDQKRILMKAVRPTAVLLLEVARSDSSLKREEIDILVALVRDMRDRYNIDADDKIEIEVVADLFDLNTSESLLERSAAEVYADPLAREAFPKWLASIATADGEISADERIGIDRVKAAIAKVLRT